MCVRGPFQAHFLTCASCVSCFLFLYLFIQLLPLGASYLPGTHREPVNYFPSLLRTSKICFCPCGHILTSAQKPDNATMCPHTGAPSAETSDNALMSPKSFSGAQKPVDTLRASLNGEKAKERSEINAEDGEPAAAVQTPADIFKVVSDPSSELKPGLSMIVHLANGTTEVVNFDSISLDTLGSEAMAEYLMSSPERLAAMKVLQKQWFSAIAKCDVAVRVTRKSFFLVRVEYVYELFFPIGADLFRFFKLPVEVQKIIVHYVVVPSQGKRYRRYNLQNRDPYGNRGLSLMLSCRQLYKESQLVFWKNNFYVDSLDLSDVNKQVRMNDFFQNVKSLTYDWKDNSRDACAFRNMAALPQLEVLVLELQWIVFQGRDMGRGSDHQNRECKDQLSFGRFREFFGLDTLIKIRGLKAVDVRITSQIQSYDEAPHEEARKKFVAYLEGVLTLPKVNCPL